ncbi:glycosyltransferase family 2 protein [Rhizobium sp. PL01]|uniref:glycosyltransferase family 2 protein n=1 Tax=Rhizobium sp. PL01 TaxID=3085631 RepID=UPI002980E84E|nr:glycosyltransferase family 2 protein [Rhizobium sp. PL01]MDW5315341.1 glycosyltransferase family 2 protein [Rhizobium sp. PL01]
MTHDASSHFVVLDGDDAGHIAGYPIIMDIADPDRVFGRTATVCIHRRDRFPALMTRPVLLDDQGLGRFYGWMPASLHRLSIRSCQTNAAAGASPAIRVRRISEARAAALIAVWTPRAAFRALRLRAAGSVKGFEYRVARLYDALNAPRYTAWIEAMTEMAPLTVSSADGREPPVFVSIVGNRPMQTDATRQSLALQSYPNVREISAEDTSFFTASSKDVAYWMRLPAGMLLDEHAVAHMMAPLLADPTVVAAYCDEDRVDARGRRFQPFFKPAWNPPLAETGWLAPDGALIRLDALKGVTDIAGTASGDLLTLASRHGKIAHVPRVLLHRLTARLPAQPSRPKKPLGETKVSVIIPTRDRADLLSVCLDGLFNGTRADDLDVIVMDNESREPETEALFARYANDRRFRRLPMPGPFNFSRACNLGVAQARYELTLLLNNDVNPIDPGWLDQMVAELDDPNAGASGAFLLFPDGYAQHAGVTLGSGSVARHSFHFRHPRAGEDYGLMAQRQEMSAVTGACLLTRRSLWQQVGGMNEEQLAVAFNDVDYCLKLRDIGKAIVWTPHARLIHHESVSRGGDDTPEKLARFASEEKYMHECWGDALRNDPFYNPNVSLTAGDWTLDAAPSSLLPRLPGLPSRISQRTVG